jgi:hypothetical protein
MGTLASWRPSWWSEQVRGSAWDRAREAMRRDWMQTKHDLGIGGHEMNQGLADTVKQAMAKQHLPSINEANPPKVIGEWDDAEIPYGYGYAARKRFAAEHPVWNEGLEAKLESEWIATCTRVPSNAPRGWTEVRALVRRGYEYDPSTNAWGPLPVVMKDATKDEKAEASMGSRE